jgi:basic amino acid/polyamine antiporter, APA family
MSIELDRNASIVAEDTTAPRPVLSIWGAVAITVGIVIGAGIFQTPSLVANIAGSGSMMMLAWLLGGVLSLVGALTYAELASTYPSAGGDYTFLTRAYGKNVSFLFAWARSLVICTGSIALIGFILGDYLTRLWDLGPYSSAIYASIAVIVLTAVNLLGLRESVRTQTVLTVLEVGGVLLVAIAGLLSGADGGAQVASTATDSTGIGALGLAMVFVLLTYGGWNDAAYISAEVRGGARAMLRTLVISIAIITFVYVAFVASIWYGLGFEALKTSKAVGVDAMEGAFGPIGGQLIGTIVAISALTSMNSTMIVGARTNYSVARDWPVFAFMGGWRDERNLPAVGFMVQAAISVALIGFGTIEKDGFSTMVEFTAPVFWFFFMLSGISLFVLRRKNPIRPRPFSVPLYPVLPAIFVATCAYLFYSSMTYAQSRNAGYVAIAVVAIGAVVLLTMHMTGRVRVTAKKE